MQEDYDKRVTIPNTAHGNEFHIHQAMYIAFCHAFKSNIPFEMHLEDHGFGDFDDLILITPTGVRAFQFKHHLDTQEQGVNDFVTANTKDAGGLVLHRYFDSLYQDIMVETSSNTSYVFCTNNTLAPQIGSCVDENGFFKSEFYEAATPRLRFSRNLIYASILKFSGNLSTLYSESIEIKFGQKDIIKFLRFLINNKDSLEITEAFFVKIWNWVTGNFPQKKNKFSQVEKLEVMLSVFSNVANGSLNIQGNILTCLISILQSSKIKSSITFWDLFIAERMFPRLLKITRFLKNLCFRFGVSELAKIKEEVKLHIQERFNTKNDVLYYAFYNEFRSNLISKRAVKIDALSVNRQFQEWVANYVHLERLFGLSFPLLGEMPTNQSGVEFIPRPKRSKHIMDFIQSPNRRLLVVNGLSGIGKSTLVRFSLRNLVHSEGEFLFLDCKQFSQYLSLNPTFHFESMSLLKLLVLDNAESLLEKDVNRLLLPLLRSAYTKKIKLILITPSTNLHNLQGLLREAELPIENLSIARLNLKSVLRRYSFLEAVSAVPNIESLMRIPFYLVLIIKFYTELLRNSDSKHDSEEKLKDYLIALAIKKPTSIVANENHKQMIKKRKAVLRRITYSSTGSISYEKENPTMNALVNDNVLIIVKDKLCFSHSLFHDYFVRHLIDKLLRDTLETNEPVTIFFDTLHRRFPHHYELYAGYLLQNPDLSLIVKKSVVDSMDEISPFSNVLMWSHQRGELPLSRHMSFLIRSCAWHYPKAVIQSIFVIFMIGKQIGLDDEEVYANLVLSLQITLMLPGYFSMACEILLHSLSHNLIPDKIRNQLSEEFTQLFCHSGRYFPLNYEEKLQFLKKHLQDDIFSLQYIFESLYYAANPSEQGDLSQALESELSLRNQNTIAHFRSEIQDKYSLAALDILLELMDDNIEIEGYIMKILDHTLGSTYVSLHECEIIREKTGNVPSFSELTPHIYSAPVYILSKKRIPQWILENLEKKIVEVLKEDKEMDNPDNNHVYGENYHKHSLLIHEQINEIRSILSSTSSSTVLRSLKKSSTKIPDNEQTPVLTVKDNAKQIWAKFDFKDAIHDVEKDDSCDNEDEELGSSLEC